MDQTVRRDCLIVSLPQQEVRMQPSICDLLRIDHKLIRSLFEKIMANERFQPSVFSQISQELTRHMAIEEKYFYPRLLITSSTYHVALEGIVEHKAVKQLQKEIANSKNLFSWRSDVQLAKTRVLSEMIDFHMEKEENHLFNEAKNVFSEVQEKEICKHFQDLEKAYKKTRFSVTLR